MPVSLRDFLRSKFDFPIRKIPIHLGLGCPHIKTTGRGCIYCNNNAFSDTRFSKMPVKGQIARQIESFRARGFNGKFIAYFQSQTNTNAPADKLTDLYSPVRDFQDDIIGISISTRPDSIDPSKLDVIESFRDKFLVWLELGLQSGNDKTLMRINRGHSVADFCRAMDLLSNRDILVCAHVILGLPGEGHSEVANTARLLRRYIVHGVKIHHLEIVKDTELEVLFRKGEIYPPTINQYLDLLRIFICHLHKDVVVHRMLGSVRGEFLIAPKWDTAEALNLAREVVFGKEN